MRTKRYVADTMPEILKKIRTEMGSEAIILRERKIKEGGFFGLFGQDRWEVIAGIDMTSPPSESVPLSASAQKDTAVVSDQFRAVMLEAEKRLSTSNQPVVVPAQSSASAVSLADLGLAATSPAVTPPKIGFVYPELKTLASRLQEQELESGFIEEVVGRAMVEIGESQDTMTPNQVCKKVLCDLVAPYVDVEVPVQRHVRFIQFFGPTGVGKTTTIAKLASDYILSGKRKVGLITTDTFRIGAVDQLKIYASILNVPLEIVYKPEDVDVAFSNLKDCDLILMDTAGRNYTNAEFAQQLQKYVTPTIPKEKYLVLSATSRTKDLEKIIHNFREHEVEKVIFTKIDETSTYGFIVNLLKKYKLKTPYFAVGQDVPDDIVYATPEKLVNLILGEDTYV